MYSFEVSMFFRTIVASVVLGTLLAAQSPFLFAADDPVPIDPDRIDACLKKPAGAGVEVDRLINPYYLRGDFDRDGKTDYAIAVKGRKSKRLGILICAGSGRSFVLGADQPINPPFSDMPGDLFFAPNWMVYTREETRDLRQWKGVNVAIPPASIRGETIAMVWEDGTAIIYWNGQAYRWAGPTH